MNVSARRAWALAALAVWLVLGLIGPMLAPYPYNQQDRDSILLAPCIACRPAAATAAPAGTTPAEPPAVAAAAAQTPAHWLGSDEFGRDELSRLLVACRVSLLLSLAMALLALLLALPAAMLSSTSPAGDGLLRWLGEVTRSLPWIFLLVAVRAALPLDASVGVILAALVALFAAGSWAIPAWVLRGAARDLLQRDFITAARAMGAGRLYLLRRHVLPNLLPLAATYFALLFAAAATVEVSLSLVGLGVPPPMPSWGNMLLPLKDIALARRAWWLYAPMLVLVPIVTCLNLYAFAQARQRSA